MNLAILALWIGMHGQVVTPNAAESICSGPCMTVHVSPGDLPKPPVEHDIEIRTRTEFIGPEHINAPCVERDLQSHGSCSYVIRWRDDGSIDCVFSGTTAQFDRYEQLPSCKKTREKRETKSLYIDGQYIGKIRETEEQK